MPPRASSRGDAGRRKHVRKQFTASPFGAPFSFGTPLRLNSQPPPRSKRGPSPGAPRRVLDVLNDEDPRGSRPNVGGYGVTAASRYPDLDAPFVSVSEQSKAPAPGAAAAAVPATAGAPRVPAGDASAVVAAARAASAEAAAAASADAAFARGKAARLAAAKAAPRVAFGGRPPPKRASPPRRAGAGRRAGIAAAATSRRSRRFRRSARDGSDSDSSFDSGSAGSGDVKEDGGANAGAFGAGPAYSFGARTSPVPGASLWWGPGAGSDASPGPGAYAGASSARLARHVPAVTFGKPRDTHREGAGEESPKPSTKPPSAKKPKKQSGGVWDPLGGVDPDAPGPGHYYDPARSPSRVGASGPKFSFGGGKDDIGKLRTPGPHDTPGPGAYHADAPATAASAGAGSPAAKKFTFGGRVGPDWASSGPGKDAPAPGSYFRDLDVVGRNVRDSANGARGGAPSFTFGGGPLRDEPSAAAARADASPGPGEYAGDADGDRQTLNRRSPCQARSGFTFGFRRDDEPKDARASTPGPGAYHDAPSVPLAQNAAGADTERRPPRSAGPAFTLAKRLPGGAMDAHVGAGDTPGPGEYDAARPGEGILGGGPAFTMGGGAAGPSPGDPSPSPGPGAYAVGGDAAGRDAPAFTMYARVPDLAGERMAAGTPGPGAYDVARPAAGAPGSPADAPAPARSPGPTLKGREAWAGSGPPGSAGKHSPGPAAYVSDAVARPHSAAPAYTMAARPSSPRDDVLGSTPGPGEYHADADAEEAALGSGGVRRRGRSPSRRKGATFGARPAHGGALSHLGESASKPGPGQYHDMHFPSAARDRGPAFTIREKLASREDLDSAPSDAPGPGEYYGEYREDDLAVLAGERRGVTIAGRTPAAGADAASFGSASPGPAYYVGPWTRADLERGPAISFQPPMASGRDAPGGPLDAVARNADVPGPGYYAPEVFQFPIRDAPEGTVGPGGEFLWAPKGYTFGWHGAFGEQARDPRADALDAADVSPGPGEYHPDAADDGVYGFAGRGETPWRPAPGVTIGRRARETPVRRSRSSPGPGEYYRAPDKSVGSAGARGPRRGARIEDRRAWEARARRETRADVPAPTDYDARSAGARRLTEPRAPAHAIAARRGASARRQREAAEAPAPGEYETARSALRATGATAFGAIGDPNRASRRSESGPAPGEYEPDETDASRKRRASKSAVSIGRGTTRDAPGGVFGRAGADATPGPGEFELDGEARARVAARARRRGAVDIARATTRDAPGGVFDGARVPRAGATPGPGEHWPDDEAAAGKKETGRGFAFPATGHASAGGALDAALRGGETPGPGEHWPEDGESRSHESRAPGFTMPKSSRDKSSRTSLTPGPGEFHPETDERGVAVGGGREPGRGAPDMARATGRSAAGGAFDARDGPGPGEHHPDLVFDDAGVPSSTKKGVRWSEPPDEARAPRASPGPGPGEYEVSRARATGAATMPKAPRRSGLVARDAALRPGPADYEPDDDAPHPMTVAGLLRRRMASGRGAPAPEDAAAARGAAAARAAARRLRSPPRPGVGEYEAGPSAFADRGKGVKMPSRAPWERLASLEASRGSNLPPSRYDPKPEAAARRLKPGRRAPRGDDFQDSYRSARAGTFGVKAKGGHKGKGVDLW